jgi:hypothetical protein
MNKDIKSQILPERMNMMHRFSIAVIVVTIIDTIFSFIEAATIDYLLDELGFDYSGQRYDELMSLANTLDGVTSIVGLLTLAVLIAFFVYTFRALSNIANFIKSKYGESYPQIKAKGAWWWLWIVPFGSFFIGQVVSSKERDATIFTKTRNLVRDGAIWIWVSGLGTGAYLRMSFEAETTAELYGLAFWDLISGIVAIVGYNYLRAYSKEILTEIESRPLEYKINRMTNTIHANEKTAQLKFNATDPKRNLDQVESAIQKIEKLNEMKESGLITQEEFEALKKRELGL